MILSRGGTQDAVAMYRAFRGRDPDVEPPIEERGLRPSVQTRPKSAAPKVEPTSPGSNAAGKTVRRAMRGSRVVLGLAGAMALVPLVVAAQQLPMSQQLPIYGCRMALSCRPSPVGVSALNDKASGNMLFGARFSWGPGFHFELVTPFMGSSSSEPTRVVDAQLFHLRGVSLWPPPTPTPPATPPAPANPSRD